MLLPDSAAPDDGAAASASHSHSSLDSQSVPPPAPPDRQTHEAALPAPQAKEAIASRRARRKQLAPPPDAGQIQIQIDCLEDVRPSGSPGQSTSDGREWKSLNPLKSLEDRKNAGERFKKRTTDRIEQILSIIERWKVEEEDAPNYVNALQTMAAKELQSMRMMQVDTSASIMEVVLAFKSERCVLVRGWQSSVPGGSPVSADASHEFIVARSAFLEVALGVRDLRQPMQTIMHKVPTLATVKPNDTLERILELMVCTGFEEVGVANEEGVVTGVVALENVFAHVSTMMEDATPVTPQTTKEKFRQKLGEKEEEVLEVKTDRGHKFGMQQRHGKIQETAEVWAASLWTELLIILCVLLDAICAVIETVSGTNEYESNAEQRIVVVTGVILYVFLYEASVRLFGRRMAILAHPIEALDMVIVLASVVIYSVVLFDSLPILAKSLVTLMRILRFLRLIKIAKHLRKLVSSNKRRYQRDGFDLDLTYVTPNCIAMSLPAVGAESSYRNPIEEVQRFFNSKYTTNYLIFNLCIERSYDIGLFGGRVEKIDVEDHNPPMMNQIVTFVEKAHDWLQEGPEARVIAVHCKGGKGRTGVMICAWLMYCKFASKADEAMAYFAVKRTGPRATAVQGVTMASQRRYVQYFERMLSAGGFRINRLLLTKLVLHTCPRMQKDGGCEPWFTIEEPGRVVFDSRQRYGVERMHKHTENHEFLALNQSIVGDVRICFYDRNRSTRDEVICFFWFHTGFIEEEHVTFSKYVIDMASSDSKCKVFRDDFRIELFFERIPSAAEPWVPELMSTTTACGAWRKIPEASANVLELAAQHRGLLGTGARARRELNADAGFFAPSKCGSQEGSGLLEVSLVPVPNNLALSDGPEVRHDKVRMYDLVGEEAAPRGEGDRVRRRRSSAANPFGKVQDAARAVVSGKKKRFQEDGFDLDLTYITPRIIAMGYPSPSTFESNFRNSEIDVYCFFQSRHAGHYRIVNLCGEKEYTLDTFRSVLVRYPFKDHNPPPMELLMPCCANIHRFLQADPDNVVAVYCKGGKGRSGLVVVCYLLYCGLFRSAATARAFFDAQRTHDRKGLTIVSQVRYAHYFEAALQRMKRREHVPTSQEKAPAMLLFLLRLHTIPHFDSDGGCDPFLSVGVVAHVDHQEYEVYRSRDWGRPVHYKPSAAHADVPFFPASPERDNASPQETPGVSRASSLWGGSTTAGSTETPTGLMDKFRGLRVAGDVHLKLQDHDVMFKPKSMCSMWLHTSFFQQPPETFGGTHRKLAADEALKLGLPLGTCSLTLPKEHIDQAAKDVKFDEDFKVELFFLPLEGECGTGKALEFARSQAGDRSHVAKPLHLERELYHRDCEKWRALNRPTRLTFEEWLLRGNETREMQSFKGGAWIEELQAAERAGAGAQAGSARRKRHQIRDAIQGGMNALGRRLSRSSREGDDGASPMAQRRPASRSSSPTGRGRFPSASSRSPQERHSHVTAADARLDGAAEGAQSSEQPLQRLPGAAQASEAQAVEMTAGSNIVEVENESEFETAASGLEDTRQNSLIAAEDGDGPPMVV